MRSGAEIFALGLVTDGMSPTAKVGSVSILVRCFSILNKRWALPPPPLLPNSLSLDPIYHHLGLPCSHSLSSMRHRSRRDIMFKNNKSLFLFRVYQWEQSGRLVWGEGVTWSQVAHESHSCQMLWWVFGYWFCTRHGCSLSLQRTLTHTRIKAERCPRRAPKGRVFPISETSEF